MAIVHNLFRALKKHVSMEELREARILADFGLEGCAHAQAASNRQILLVDRETLEAMGLGPGILRENIATEGLNVNSLPIGQHLRIGEARLEVRSEEHTSELQSQFHLVCRLLLEKKKKKENMTSKLQAKKQRPRDLTKPELHQLQVAAGTCDHGDTS